MSEDVPRDELVDALLWMLHQHQCCADPELQERLEEEVGNR